MDQEARIVVSLTERRFEVVGSESFVKEQTEALKDFIVENMGSIPPQQPQTESTKPPEVGSPSISEDRQNDYDFIFEEDAGTVRILPDLPGTTNAEKTVNAALLYLFGKSIYTGEEEASAKEIREVCEEHACLDGNFAAHLADRRSLFRVEGQHGSSNKSYRLTKPGKKAAQELVDELDQE